jgi:steroid 5-alpha reductase family enzyme
MLALVTLWGARLTFNFARKGGYRPGIGEDYRWQVLRSRLPGWQFQVLNFFFIAIYQNLILLLIALPAYTAYRHPSSLGPLDIAAAVLFLAFLSGETIADQQQWNFHQRKAAGTASSRFLNTGLFRYSRHPNFFFEQAQWWVIFAFGAIAAGSVLQPTVIGAVLLTLLFLGSSSFTESITKSKYPEYAEYQRSTSAQIPWFPLPPKERSVSSSPNT